MIQPLRATHRAVFLTWAILLPVLFIEGLLSRHQPPPASGPILQSPAKSKTVRSEKNVKVGTTSCHVKLLQSPDNPAEQYLQLNPEAPVVSPDVLVYWSEQSSPSGLPEHAQLLGSFRPMEIYLLPTNAQGTGYAILYSLAQQKSIGSVSLGAQP